LSENGNQVSVSINSQYTKNSGIRRLVNTKEKQRCVGGAHAPLSCTLSYRRSTQDQAGSYSASVSMNRRNRNPVYFSLQISTDDDNAIFSPDGRQVVLSVPNLEDALGLVEFSTRSENRSIRYRCNSQGNCSITIVDLFGLEIK
ncbi:MAG: hypothetical protein AAF203_07010, partial [Pseudomonadota bacterium]